MDFAAQRAFTLMELMIGLAIIAIVIGLAAPSMAQLHRGQQLGGYQAELMRLVQQSRHHALVNRSRVTVCALDGQGRCVGLTAGVLSSFVDANGNRALDAGETLLQTLPVPGQLRTHWAGTLPLHSLHFAAQGTTYLSNGTFTLCHPAESARHARLVISRQGRVRAERHAQPCPLG
ncbi:MAG TPA: GspH/FimT family pseudopilin [Pseudomonas sp.]|nr:GspH/FimT family pseudopilin [Pseudomonas sp.]